ncbi:MAG TPA: hypothetical protein VNS79_12690 [Sphingobium sp.]|nr:hypothetical protein [Sphingobium sp.]
MVPAPPSTRTTDNRAEAARKIARFAMQPRRTGAFAQAAYQGALAVAARLAAAPAPEARLALLTDMYIHWQHDVPYKLADAALVLTGDDEQRHGLVTRLCREGVVQRRRAGAAREPLREATQIELSPAARADLSGHFAHHQLSLGNPPREPDRPGG